MGRKVVHFEIMGRDGETTRKFYAQLFDWKIDANNPMNYGIVEAPPGGGIGGGIAGAPPGACPNVTFYVAVPDLHATLAEAGRLGGKTILEPHQVPGGPKIAMFEDPDGNKIGLLEDMGA
jgi:predicted enzyme related to lactoylglutathione lyase